MGEEWNQQNIAARFFHLVVTSGMWIEAVNASEGDAESMSSELRRASTFCLRLRRPKRAAVEEEGGLHAVADVNHAFRLSLLGAGADVAGLAQTLPASLPSVGVGDATMSTK